MRWYRYEVETGYGEGGPITTSRRFHLRRSAEYHAKNLYRLLLNGLFDDGAFDSARTLSSKVVDRKDGSTVAFWDLDSPL